MIYQNLLKTIENYSMLDGVKSVLLGFSGGADSTALLHYMTEFANIKVYAVHVNHGIRGQEAMRDQNFCTDMCNRYGIPLFIEIIDVPKLAEESGLSVEETARNERYRIFDELCNLHNIDRIMTAHNSDDNIETVIFNMARGTSLHGLCGIPPIRGNIIRPLIECSKVDIIDYCNRNNLDYVTDSTNNDNMYTRNFIRNEIAPKLKILNPSIDTAVTRMCKLLRTDDNYFNSEVSAIPDDITRSKLAALHDSILSRWLVRKYESLNSNGFLGNDHIRKLMDMVRNGYPKKINLPGKINFIMSDNDIYFEKNLINEKKSIPKTYLKSGKNHIDGSNFTIFVVDNEKDIKLIKNIYKLFIYKVFNFDRIIGYIYIRSRQDGDKYKFGGMTRNVKKLLCDRRIPQYERDSIPFICDDNGILWIPGFDVRNDVKIQNENEKKLYIAYCILQGEEYDNADS